MCFFLLTYLGLKITGMLGGKHRITALDFFFIYVHLQYRYNICMHIVYPFNTALTKILTGCIYWLGTLVLTFAAQGVHPQESAATFDEIPCWTPLADALLATLHMDDDVSSGPKTRWKKTHQEGGGGCFRPYLRCACSPAKRSHRFRFWDSGWRPKMDPFILLCIGAPAHVHVSTAADPHLSRKVVDRFCLWFRR